MSSADNYPFKIGDFVEITHEDHPGYVYEITHISHGMFFCGKDVPGRGWSGQWIKFAEINDSPLIKALR